MERHRVARSGAARAVQHRLVVAGEQAFRSAAVGHLIGLEPGLEELRARSAPTPRSPADRRRRRPSSQSSTLPKAGSGPIGPVPARAELARRSAGRRRAPRADRPRTSRRGARRRPAADRAPVPAAQAGSAPRSRRAPGAATASEAQQPSRPAQGRITPGITAACGSRPGSSWDRGSGCRARRSRCRRPPRRCPDRLRARCRRASRTTLTCSLAKRIATRASEPCMPASTTSAPRIAISWVSSVWPSEPALIDRAGEAVEDVVGEQRPQRVLVARARRPRRSSRRRCARRAGTAADRSARRPGGSGSARP